MKKMSVAEIRSRAVRQTLFNPVSLAQAIARLKFVQIDPIKAPSTAQDLCLRHRVKDYKEGDIERAYSKLKIEEDVLYAYGYVTRELWARLRPRQIPPPVKFEKQVLDQVAKMGKITAEELDPFFGKQSVRNDWGGQSRMSKRALESLHRAGMLRVAGRKNGIRIYEPSTAVRPELAAEDRFSYLAMVVAGLLSPVDRKRLSTILSPIARSVFGAQPNKKIITQWLNDALNTGQLLSGVCEGLHYVWPATAEDEDHEVQACVRFLAPFDPLVWDRYRFEHIWGWQYRFEAYTPPAKRIRGYYAMPLLWIDKVIGWVNVELVEGRLKVDAGFTGSKPAGKLFKTEFEKETERLLQFFDASKRNSE